MKKIGERKLDTGIVEFYTGINIKTMLKHDAICQGNPNYTMMITFVEKKEALKKCNKIPPSDYIYVYGVPNGYKDYDALIKMFNENYDRINKIVETPWFVPAGLNRGIITGNLEIGD